MGAPLLISAAMVLVGADPALAADAPTAQVIQDGWWNRLQGPQEGEPAGNPLRPVIPRLPAPPTVPGDSIAVGATAGQVDKVAAVGIDVLAPSGGTIDVLKLTLKESKNNGANINPDMAKVAACPVINPWGPDKNANWVDRPQADCEKTKIDGERGDEGVWTFDLTTLGALWADPASGFLPNGVLLTVEPVPGTVQVSWVGLDAGGPQLEVVSSAPPEDQYGLSPSGEVAGEFTTVPEADTSTLVPTEETGLGFDAGASAYSGDSSSYSGPSELEAAAPPQSSGAAAPTAALPATTPRPSNLKTRPVRVWGNLPASSALLVPAVLSLALLLGWALGPAGRPLPVHSREGGLSRALARRRAGVSVSKT